MLLALTRAVPASIARCELTHLARTPIDYARAVAQHAAYEAALEAAGCRVQRLPEAPDLPDSVFVEDTAIVLDDLAVIARPGADSRRSEVETMAAALRPHRHLASIEPPGTLDGGDVLVVPPYPALRGTDRAPGRVFVGVSGRTNAEGARQLAEHLRPHGFDVVAIHVRGCLHLKSAVTLASLPPEEGSHAFDNRNGRHTQPRPTLLINPAWVEARLFDGFDVIEVDAAEPAAANVLRIGERLICAAEHPRTRHRLEARGFVTVAVPGGELAKAEGAMTCCSVVFTSQPPRTGG